MKVFHQIIRGCGTLPHVGEHPGTAILLIFLGLGAVAGLQGGAWGVLGGCALMALVMVPIYLYGAYDRANLSDTLRTREQAKKQTPEAGK